MWKHVASYYYNHHVRVTECTWVVQPALRWDVCAFQTSGVDTDTSKSNTRRSPTDRPKDRPHCTDRTSHNVDARQQTKR